jgi:phage tail-like protein
MRPQGPTFWLLNGPTGWRTAFSDKVSLGATSGMRLAANPEGPLSLLSNAGDLGGLVLPRGMALDERSTLYLLDVDEGRIKHFDPAKGEFVRLPSVGGHGPEAREFAKPSNIACAGRNLYVADRGNRRVQAFDLRSLALRHLWGSWNAQSPMVAADDAEAWIPEDVAATEDAAYILDRRFGKVYCHDLGSDLLRPVVHEPSAHNRWTRMAVDRKGRIYLLDPEKRRLDSYDRSGRRIFRLTGQSLTNLKATDIPDAVLRGLENLIDQDYVGEHEFFSALSSRSDIGAANTSKYWAKIAEQTGIWDAGDVRDRFDPPLIRMDNKMRFCLRFCLPARFTGSLWFRTSDLKDPGSMAAKLGYEGDALSAYLQDRLSTDTKELIKTYNAGNAPREELDGILADLQTALTKELNRQLRNSDLYDEQRFSHLKLTREIKDLIQKEPKNETLKHLNRLLLEEAFPREIEKGCLVWYGPQAAPEAPPLEDPLALCRPEPPEGLIFDRTGTRVHPDWAEQLKADTRLYQNSGTWYSRALDSEIYQCQWHRLEVDLAALPAGTQIIVSTYADETDRPVREIQNLPGDRWDTRYTITGAMQPPPSTDPAPKTKKPEKPHDLLVQSREGRYLWLRLELKGDGYATPAVRAIRAHYPRSSYLDYLPDVYKADDESRWFLERFLSIFQTEWDSLERRIADFAQYFDPDAVPDDAALEYLAQWLALPLEKEWDLEEKRRLLALAPRLYARRGTLDGLQDYLRVYLKNMIDARSDSKEARFKVTAEVLEKLKIEGVPDSVLKHLEDLLDRSIVGEGELSSLLRARLGDVSADKFSRLIQKYACQDQLEYPRIVEGFRERRFLQVAMENQANLGRGAPLWGPVFTPLSCVPPVDLGAYG